MVARRIGGLNQSRLAGAAARRPRLHYGAGVEGPTGTEALYQAVRENPELVGQMGNLGEVAAALRSLPQARAGFGQNTTFKPDGRVVIEGLGRTDNPLQRRSGGMEAPPARRRWQPGPYEGKTAPTGVVTDRNVVQQPLEGVIAPGGREAITGFVPPTPEKERVNPYQDLSGAIPDLLAGRVDAIALPEAWSPWNRGTATLTRGDFLRGTATPQEVEQRLAEITALTTEGFPVRVPRTPEQAEAQQLVQGRLNRVTGLPDDQPPHLRGGSGALLQEGAAFNADAGGYQGMDPSEVSVYRSSAQPNPYGKAAVVERLPGGAFGIREYEVGGAYNTVDREPDATASFLREKQVSRGAAAQQAAGERTTPVVSDRALARMGFVELERPDRNLIGYLPGQGESLGEGKGRADLPVFKMKKEGLYRLGHATNRDEEGLRGDVAQVLGAGYRTQWGQDPDTTIAAGGLHGALKRGHTFQIGDGAESSLPLFDPRDRASATEYIRMLQGQPSAAEVRAGAQPRPGGFLAGENLQVIGGQSGNRLQTLASAVDENGMPTGYLSPLRLNREWSGPVALMPGGGEAVGVRKDAEIYGAQRGIEAGLEGMVTREVGAGAFMADPAPAPRDPVADLLARGRITPEMIRRSPEMQEAYRSASARELLNQASISAGMGPVFPTDTRQLVFPAPSGSLPPAMTTNPGAASTVEATAALAAASNPNWGAGGGALQQEAAARLFAPGSGLTQAPSGPRYQMPARVAPEPGPAYGSYVVDSDGQMRLAGVAEAVPTRLSPDPIDDVAAYMTRREGMRAAPSAATGIRGGDPFYIYDDARNLLQAGTGMQAPAAPVAAPVYEQPELVTLPRMGEEVRVSGMEVPVGRPAGPYAGADYYGTGDRTAYQQAATAKGAQRGFDYRTMAEAIGGDIPTPGRIEVRGDGTRVVRSAGELAQLASESDARFRAHERAMAQLAMRVRNRTQNPPPSPRFPGAPPEQGVLGLSSPLY